MIADVTRLRMDEIEDSDCLYHDLSISGDDAHQLLEDIKRKFGTRFTDFDFYSYFPEETEALWFKILKLVGIDNDKKRFTFGHLFDVVRAGQWFDPAKDE